MTILRDLSIFWVMFHVIFLFLMLFRSRFTRKKTILAAGRLDGEMFCYTENGNFVLDVMVSCRAFPKG